MVHVRGSEVAATAAMIAWVSPQGVLVVPTDVGKYTAMTLVADAASEQLVAPFTFRLDRQGLSEVVAQVSKVAVDRGGTVVRVGVEAAGHYQPSGGGIGDAPGWLGGDRAQPGSRDRAAPGAW